MPQPGASNGARGGAENSWCGIDASSYKVRDKRYLEDRIKSPSDQAMCVLVAVDLFDSDVDVVQVGLCPEVGTVHRLRARGEERRLLLLNFRVVPLHLVIVWAVPDDLGEGPAQSLLEKFMTSMSTRERNMRLKVIPNVLDGPWVARKTTGSRPAILGKNIPIDYYPGDRYLEVSINIGVSTLGSRVARVMKFAIKRVNMEMAFVIEGQAEAELPERVFGGYRLQYPDISTARPVVVPQDSCGTKARGHDRERESGKPLQVGVVGLRTKGPLRTCFHAMCLLILALACTWLWPKVA